MEAKPYYMRIISSILSVAIILGIFACTSPPDYPVEPFIEYVGFEKDTLNQGQSKTDDFVFLTISFTDGDGDLGPKEGEPDTIKTIVFTDLRTGVSETEFDLPEISDKGASNGISGEIIIKVPTTCCIFPAWVSDVSGPCDDSEEYPIDEVSWEVYLIDRAGNESNRLELPARYLRCN